jgi:hypothetical protein
MHKNGMNWFGRVKYFSICVISFLFFSCQSIDLSDDSAVKLGPQTHYLILGGGYSAKGNQASLEKNVLYVNGLLKNKSVYKLFANGATHERSLQHKVNSDFPSPFQEMLFSCFTAVDQLSLFYRPHQIKKLDGPLNRVAIDRYFKEHGSLLKKGDKLVCYYTGHGSKGLKKDSQNTSLLLWHDGAYRMKDFAQKLQELPTGVDVVLIMVQCYSGGFQNVIFQNGDSPKGLSKRNIAGFFSTVYNRISAGCTPQVNDDDFEEYSRYFWRGLTGLSSVGDDVEKADFDNDGRVSLNEAHAYVIINLDSVDVPTTTSELFLREFVAGKKTFFTNNKNMPLHQLLVMASPLQRKVISSLVLRVNKPMSSTLLFLEKEGRDLELKIAQMKRRQELNKKLLAKQKIKVAKLLKYHYPEVMVKGHVNIHEVFDEKDKYLIDLLYGNQDFLEFERLYKQQKILLQKSSDLDSEWVFLTRLMRQLENALIEKDLLQSAPLGLRQKYLKLKSLEASFLD